MEKTYKRVPFDIELAKKIANGEIQGRIVAKSKNGYLAVSLKQIDTISSTLNIYHGDSYVEIKYGHNSMLQYLEESNILFIELPEETPKHEFKVGDLVEYNELTGNITNINDNGIEITILPVGTIVVKDTENIKIIYDDNGYGFKPFDKVLVRDNDRQEWAVDFYSHKVKTDTHCCVGSVWTQVIPYEGNEHLVGTTKNLK